MKLRRLVRRLLLHGAQVGKENHFADRIAIGEQHRQPVDAQAEAAGGRHAVGQRLHVVDVDRVGLVVAKRVVAAVGLVIFGQKALQLVERVVDFAKGVEQLHAADKALEALDKARVVRRGLGQRANVARVVDQEGGLD